MTAESLFPPRIAVLIPCYNEASTIRDVVQDFQQALPEAAIYVYDNNSRDETFQYAEQAGAITRRETRQGKGNVVRRMFNDIEADVYLLVDGDRTYDAAIAPEMVSAVWDENLAMVVGNRVHEDPTAYRHGHVFGNQLLTGVLTLLFGRQFTDILSGYRAFSRRFVKSFPVLTRGFEIETELTVHCLSLQLPVKEISTIYKARPEGSVSKLNTFRDGIRILFTIFDLFKNERPLLFFFSVSLLLLTLAAILAYPLFVTFLATAKVPRFPTAILCVGIVVSALLSIACGLILDTVARGRQEMKLLTYLATSATQPAIPMKPDNSTRQL